MDIVIKLLPTLALVGLGYGLKRFKVLDAQFGRNLLKFVLLVAAPALALRSISQLRLDASLLALLVLPVALAVVSFALAKLFQRKTRLAPKQFAVFLIATMAVNSGFTLPFVISLTGDAGAARVALFNVMNSLLLFGWVYAIAVSYGHRKRLTKIEVTKKVVLTPIFIAILLALVMNLTETAVPHWLSPTADLLANLTSPLILFALGFLLELRLKFPLQTFQALAIRMLGGLAIGAIFVELFNLAGADRTAVLLLSASPVGFNAITFSSIEKLDDTFAASMVSSGLVVGLVLLSVLAVFLS